LFLALFEKFDQKPNFQHRLALTE